MKNLNHTFRSVLFSSFWFLAVFMSSSYAAATELPNGGSISGEISTPGEVDTYSFTANAGDTVRLRVADTTRIRSVNSFSPEIELFSPSGALLASNGVNAIGDPFLVAEIGRILTESGEYSVSVRHDRPFGDETGIYDLYFVALPGANENEGGVLVVSESLVSDRIDLGDMDSYTFSANAGQTVFLRLRHDSERIGDILFQLFDPNGNSIGDPTIMSGFVFTTLERQLLMTGTYTVVVSGFIEQFINFPDGDVDGVTYDLFYSLIQIPGANEGGGISGGQAIDQVIDLGGFDTYAFTPNTLDASVSFTVIDLDDSSLSPRIFLFDPNGDLIRSGVGLTVASIDADLTIPGQYTLVITDEDSTFFDSTSNLLVDASERGEGPYRLTGVGDFTGAARTCNGLVVTVDLSLGQVATSGDDVIVGTAGDDTIVAFEGNDTICGLSGNDTINAGLGDDWVDAGAGDDSVFGLAGADVLRGGAGADEIVSGNDDDLVAGGGGADMLNGGLGDDLLFGDSGDDSLFGQGGSDLIFGGDGVDFLLGVGGADELHGQNGSDVLNGGLDDDVLYGGDGEDTLFGLLGADKLDGGMGDDLVFGQLGADTVLGGGGNDKLFGNEGDDVITALSGTNVINGGAGNDTISGGSGDDSIFGDGNLQQAGDDVIDGGSGSDLILGFSGSDTITSTDGSVDTVNGGPDTDNCITDGIDIVFLCP